MPLVTPRLNDANDVGQIETGQQTVEAVCAWFSRLDGRRNMRTQLYALLVLTTFCVPAGVARLAPALDFPGPAPGRAEASIESGALQLENNVLRVQWRVAGSALRPATLTDKLSGRTLALDKTECFQLLLARTPLPGNRTLRASELTLVGSAAVESLEAEGKSLRAADRLPGRAIAARLVLSDGLLEATWRAELRDGSNYVRQHITVQTRQKELELAEVVVWDVAAPGAEVQGVVDGSPVVAGNWFFAAEHPMSKSRLVEEGREEQGEAPRFVCAYQVNGPIAPHHPREFRSVVGVTPPGQLRRGFLHYLERERAQPYQPLLHYNNGFEIGYEYWCRKQHGQPGEAEAFRLKEQQVWLEAIDVFGRELVANRGVVVDSFAHDYGWDDENLVWQFHEGYADGFRPAQQAAAK